MFCIHMFYLIICCLQLIHSYENTKQSQKIFGITKLGPCTALLDNGKKIELTSLDRPSKPRIDTKGDYYYKFNPCSSFKCGTNQSATCQEATNGNVDYILGEQDSVNFTISTDGTIVLNYMAKGPTPQTPRKSIIKCICDKKESYTFDTESPTFSYQMTFKSPCCCPDGCKNGGLSVGTILVIIFISILAVYLIVGILFMKFKNNASGIEMIPNSGLWRDVPGNIKSGITFSISKIRGRPSGSYSQL